MFPSCPLPSVLAHQVPNAKKLRRKKELWEKLAARGELPREARKAQARLRRPAAPKAHQEPQQGVERPFYDLWASDSECLTPPTDTGPSGAAGAPPESMWESLSRVMVRARRPGLLPTGVPSPAPA